MVLNSVLWMMDGWAKRHKPDADADAIVTRTIGLFVATDIPNLHQDEFFQQRISFQKKALKDNHGIDVEVLLGDKNRNSGKPATEAQVNALFDRNRPGWVGYPGIFLDQQLAACATIGFVGTEESSFSNFIRELRKDNLTETCGLDFESP
mmetsp:Transcript_5390/g.12796  ORF Transcript_5390/g.12796 Transcript_5390/m.12796 type:complete len:150 (+) Transcript_5390:1164-1613(+)